MLFSLLRIQTDRPIRKVPKDPRIDHLRAAVVNASQSSPLMTEDDKRWINFRPPPPYRLMPKILYAQPAMKKSYFDIFAFDQDGHTILEKMGKALLKKGEIRLGDEKFSIDDFSLCDTLPFLPSKSVKMNRYYTATPMILFDKKRDHIEYIAICNKYRRKDPAEYDRQMKKAIANLLRANILYQLKQRVSSEKSFSFVHDIKIEITSFRFFAAKYHKDQPKTPMLFMEFNTDWKLPLFLGHHIGKGYGAINTDKRGA